MLVNKTLKGKKGGGKEKREKEGGKKSQRFIKYQARPIHLRQCVGEKMI